MRPFSRGVAAISNQPGGSPHAPTRRPGDVRWAHDVPPRPVRWLIAGLIALRIVTLLAGPRNVGKSLVAAWLAKQVTDRGGFVWLLSLEDHLESVVRPRLEVAGVDLKRVRVSATPYRFPRDLDQFRGELRRHREEGMPDSLVVMDSMQRFVPKYYAAEPSSETLEGLRAIAEEFDVAIVIVAHFTKGAARTVEQAVGGAGSAQNLSKGIFVVGHEPKDPDSSVRALLGADEEGLPRRVVACERLGVGPTPDSMAFELDTRRLEATDRGEPFLRYVGPSRASALEVMQATRREAAGPTADETKIAKAAAWIVTTLLKGPVPTKRLEALATEAGVFYSRNTFDRARREAQAEAIPPARLREVLGADAYDALSEEDRKVHWVRSGWTGAPLPPAALPTPPAPPSNNGRGGVGQWASGGAVDG